MKSSRGTGGSAGRMLDRKKKPETGSHVGRATLGHEGMGNPFEKEGFNVERMVHSKFFDGIRDDFNDSDLE